MRKFLKTRTSGLFLLVALPLFSTACGPFRPVLKPMAIAQETSGKEPRLVSDTLYFGTREPEGFVTEAEWGKFLKETVTPSFPEGLTTWEGKGQWRGKKGRVIREKCHILLLVHTPGLKTEKAIQGIIKVYREKFHQESVMRIQSGGKISF